MLWIVWHVSDWRETEVRQVWILNLKTNSKNNLIEEGYGLKAIFR